MSGDLPEGWASATGSALFAFVTSGSRGWARYYTEGGPRFLRVGNLDRDTIKIDLADVQCVTPPADGEGTRTRVAVGDIVVSITADVGMVGVVDRDVGDAYVNQHLALARPRPGVLSDFVAWYLASRDGGQQQFFSMDRGATKAGLSLDDIRSLCVPVPPLAEQRRIVDKVEALLTQVNAVRDRLAKVPGILKQFRQSVLAAACSGRLTEDWRGGSRREWKSLPASESSLTVRIGPFGSLLHREDYEVGGVPLVNPMHIRDGRIWPTKDCSVGKTKAGELSAYRLQHGDVVLGRRGEMGRAAVIGPLEAGYLCGTGSLFIRPDAKRFRSEFLCLVLRSPQSVATLEANSVGSTMTNLNQRALGAVELPCISLEEQDEIIGRVSRLWELAGAMERRVADATALTEKSTQSILGKAFRGELVPTEADLARAEGRDYESASLLLERVNGSNGHRVEPTKRRGRKNRSTASTGDTA